MDAWAPPQIPVGFPGQIHLEKCLKIVLKDLQHFWSCWAEDPCLESVVVIFHSGKAMVSCSCSGHSRKEKSLLGMAEGYPSSPGLGAYIQSLPLRPWSASCSNLAWGSLLSSPQLSLLPVLNHPQTNAAAQIPLVFVLCMLLTLLWL